MATIIQRETKKGTRYTFQIRIAGVKDAKTFASKVAGAAWAKNREHEITVQGAGAIIPATVLEMLQHYIDGVDSGAIKRKGARWEKLRCRKFMRTVPWVGKQANDIRPADAAAWRDALADGKLFDRKPDGTKVQCKPLKPNSVHREMGVLRRVFEVARKEWQNCKTNPFDGVEWPTRGPARKRRISADEIRVILMQLDYKPGKVPKFARHRIAIAFLFALETGMRNGEILGLTSDTVDYRECCAHLPKTKNGDARDVPLNDVARALLKLLPLGAPTLFDLDAGTRDVMFRTAVKDARIKNLHFHDTRHEAITRMVQKGLPIAAVANAVGTRNLNQLMTYYNPTTREVAAMLNAPLPQAPQPSNPAPTTPTQPQRARPALHLVRSAA